MVVGPALPEVNPVQRARLAALARLGRDAAFDRVYRIPGMQKVNQALGRLVRAPGQRARVLLHCGRFAEPGYARLLAPEYQAGRRILDDGDLAALARDGPRGPRGPIFLYRSSTGMQYLPQWPRPRPSAPGRFTPP